MAGTRGILDKAEPHSPSFIQQMLGIFSVLSTAVGTEETAANKIMGFCTHGAFIPADDDRKTRVSESIKYYAKKLNRALGVSSSLVWISEFNEEPGNSGIQVLISFFPFRTGKFRDLTIFHSL